MKVVLFQCLECKTIVGDTSSQSHSLPDLNAIVLSDIPHNSLLKKHPDIQEPTGTYQLLCCANCKSQVGKFYLKSPTPALVRRFMIDLARVLSYQLDIPQSTPAPQDTGDLSADLSGRVEALERLTCFLYDKLKAK